MKFGQFLQLVTFDVTGTLIKVKGSVGVQYAKAAQKSGILADETVLEANFRPAFWKFWGLYPCYGAVSGKAVKDWWKFVVSETFLTSRIEVEKETVGKISEELFEQFKTSECWETLPGAEETLSFLAEESVPIFAVSNTDDRIHSVLEGLNLTKYFSKILTCQELGVAKPNPSIFTHALKQADVPAQNAMHIGNSLTEDVVPAKHLGLTAVLVGEKRQFENIQEEAPLIFEDLNEFLTFFKENW